MDASEVTTKGGIEMRLLLLLLLLMNERELELIGDNVDEESNIVRRCFVVLFRIQIATFV